MEKVKSNLKTITTILILILVGAVLATLISQGAQPRTLYPQEITNYEGEDLSWISDFRPNSIKGTQHINQTTYRLQITGLVNQTIEYTYTDVLTRFQEYKKVVTLHCVEGWSVKILWQGFLVDDLLKQAEINPNATAAIFYAADGYSTSLPLSYLTSNNIMIAYKINGITLPPENGFPFQLVAESQYGYKWIKWITKIEVTDNPNYLGTWESRGYPNNATIPNP
jgi:DMSO/TMAO reductase YedYZ molybdopterin-dependent catalytic subunit